MLKLLDSAVHLSSVFISQKFYVHCWLTVGRLCRVQVSCAVCRDVTCDVLSLMDARRYVAAAADFVSALLVDLAVLICPLLH